MMFKSILFPESDEPPVGEAIDATGCFADLHLDQIIAAITAAKETYDLAPFFRRPLRTTDAVRYRHEVMRDLESPELFRSLNAFAEAMCRMRAYLLQADKFYDKYQKQALFVNAVETYCAAAERLAGDLVSVGPKSRGLSAFQCYLTDYVVSGRFLSLSQEMRKIKVDLARVKYSMLIDGLSVTVRKYASEPNLGSEIEAAFERFSRSAVKDYKIDFPELPEMNHVEERILELVARLYPEIFAALARFCAENQSYLDHVIGTFDREIQFYVAYIEHIAPFRQAGLRFCYPEVSLARKDVYCRDGFDLALAQKLRTEHAPIICNDFALSGGERILVVSGPNQGGKTTFSRMFGQLHYLASIGCPVAAKEARLFLFDRLFTHFEREEHIATLRGKLHDDLVRIHSIIEAASRNSIVIMNEIFTSTTLQDAIFLSGKVMQKIVDLDLLCVWVTFVDEVAAFGEQVVSMVGGVDANDPTLRTYKIVRKPADGLAYAMAIANKYRLSYEQIRKRLGS